MKASSARNSNGMRAENNSTDNVKNVAVASSPNGPSFEEEKRCDISKPKRHTGKATISRDIGDKKQIGNESPKLTYTSEDGIHYEPGDCVYIDSQRPDVPFFICSVKEFRMSKRDSLVVSVRWYYRPSEIPDSVYQLLVQDRNHEHGSRDHILGDEAVKERELFISDATDVYPAVALKGKCKVRPFSDVCQSLKEFITNTDCFFYVLGYNPETRRLANTKGEIRVGPSHQATIPECIVQHQQMCPGNGSLEARELPKEKLVWCPQMQDCDLKLYLRAARSIAQYAGMCNGGTPEDGFRALQQDATTSNALNVLHESGYDAAKALQVLVKRPYPKELRSKWTDDETKKFVKGLRQFGKNFFKIRKELLHHKETSELVEYYYMWKKTQSALSSRPHRRRRHNVLKRKVHTRASRNISSEYLDLSSCSEDGYDSEDSERDMSLYCCRHCYTTDSRSWHHGGQNKVILCVDCRIFYKKYGKMPNIEEARDPPPFMFKSIVERELREEDGLYYLSSKHGLRSRRGAALAQSTLRSGKLKSSSPVEGLTLRESQINGRRLGVKMSKPASPSSSSTSSSMSTSSVASKEKKKGKSKKANVGKRLHDQSPDSQNGAKRKRTAAQDSEDEAGDSSDTNSSLGGRDSVNLPENDASSVCSNSSNNEERCNNRSPSPPLPLVDSLPAKKFSRVIPSEGGRSCTRTDCIFIQPAKPKTSTPPRESNRATVSASTENRIKSEASESSSSDRYGRPSSRKSPDEKPATITSHFESMRSMMEGAGLYPMYPPHMPGLSSPSGVIPIPAGISSHAAAAGEYRMMPMHMYPAAAAAAAAFGAREARDSASKYAEGFEQWYAPFRAAQAQAGQHAALPFLSGGAVEPNGIASRSLPSPAHEALMNRMQGRAIAVDPISGLPVAYPGQHHSHSHLHTHFHMYPHEQQLRALQAQGIDPAYLQAHPELAAAWRNQAALWHPEALMHHLHGNGARGMISPEELTAHSPIHGLGSTPLDRQLQQQLFLSQHSKFHQQAALQQQQQQQQLLAQEDYMRQFRQHQHELQIKQRMEEVTITEHYLANCMRGKEHRNLQSPSQLDNVVKKSLDSSGAYTSPSKRPVTIDLSDD